MRIRLWASAVLFVFIAYMFDFEAHLYPTWDDNRNLQILDEMMRGQWQNLYQHASPAFYLLFLPLAYVATPTGLAFACTVCHLGGQLLAASLIGRQLALPNGLRIYAFLALALCPLSLFTGHSFTVEAPSLLFFWGGVFALYFRRPWLAGLLLGLAVGINYKVLLWLGLLFIAALAERLMENGKCVPAGQAFSIKTRVLPFATTFGLTLILLSLPAFWLPMHPLQYARSLFAVAILRPVNPLSEGNSALDVFFYLRYLFEWDNLLPLLLVLALSYSWWKLNTREPGVLGQTALARTLLMWSILLILVMTFLPKAPRALYPIMPALFTLAIFSARMWGGGGQRTGRRLAWFVGPVLLIVSAVQAVRAYYPYRSRAYYQAGAIVNALPATAITSPFSFNLYSRLNATHRTQFKAPLKCNIEPVKGAMLVDDPYRFLVGCRTPELEEADETLPNAAVDSPILWLEHCEFTGITYEEALERRSRRLGKGQVLIVMSEE